MSFRMSVLLRKLSLAGEARAVSCTIIIGYFDVGEYSPLTELFPLYTCLSSPLSFLLEGSSGASSSLFTI
jgi:hypothetical protein